MFTIPKTAQRIAKLIEELSLDNSHFLGNGIYLMESVLHVSKNKIGSGKKKKKWGAA